jgi:uncharacterized protein (DUF1778 family)
MPSDQVRSVKMDVRLSPEAKVRLRTAARALNQSVSQFVIESALRRADETLADRQHFVLDAEKWVAFMAALDAPPAPMTRLGQLFREPSLFESAKP